jgi:Zn-dependent metalloprotease
MVAAGGCGGGGGSDLSQAKLEELVKGSDLQVHLGENQDVRLLYGDKIGDVFPEKVESVEDAISALNNVKTVLGIGDPYDEFDGDSVTLEEDTVYRLARSHRGVPVYAREVKVITGGNGAVSAISSNYCKDIGASFNTTPSLSQADAESAAREAVKREAADFGSSLDDADIAAASELVIYTLYDTPPVLTWRVSACGGPVNHDYFIDQQGKVIDADSDEMSISAKGTDRFKKERTFEVVSFDKSNTVMYEMYDRERKIRTNTANETDKLDGTPIVSSSTSEWGQDEVGAHYNLAVVYEYYKNILSWESFDDKGMEINITVGYREKKDEAYCNAMWYSRPSSSGGFFLKYIEGIAFGSALPFSSVLDIVAHEYTHGVEKYLIGLNRKGEAGALKETYADILGNFVEMSVRDRDGWVDSSWIIGKELEGPVRDLRDPHRFEDPAWVGDPYYKNPNPPEGFDQDKNDNGGVHANSTIISHAAYLMHTDGGGVFDSDTLAKLWFKSLAGMPKDAKFTECRAQWERIGKVYKMTEDEFQCVRNAFDEVNVGGVGKTFLATYNGSPSLGAKITLTRQDGDIKSYPRTYGSYSGGKITVTLTAGDYQINARSADGTASYSGTVTITSGQGSSVYDAIEIKLTGGSSAPDTADVWDGTIDTSWYDKNPSATIFDIRKGSELAGLAKIVNGTGALRDSFEGKTIRLVSDISLASREWTPIGIGVGVNSSFTGTFDGGGHTISNLTITGDQGARIYFGLFGKSHREIKNVHLTGVSIDASSSSSPSPPLASYYYAGGLVGWNDGTITNCTASGAVSSSSSLSYAGGLVGANYGKTITNCTASGKVIEASSLTGGTAYRGGFIGYGSGSLTGNKNETGLTPAIGLDERLSPPRPSDDI